MTFGNGVRLSEVDTFGNGLARSVDIYFHPDTSIY